MKTKITMWVQHIWTDLNGTFVLATGKDNKEQITFRDESDKLKFGEKIIVDVQEPT